MILVGAAASIGFVHTLLGPDHYLPFIAMSQSGQWSTKKTTFVTIACGIGHVLSSVIIGMIGVTLGITVSRLEAVESARGDIAAWALMTLGLLYFVWGMRRAIRYRTHEHPHVHGTGAEHVHRHDHTPEHMHVHDRKPGNVVTPWALFLIFIFGPCEPLIPLLMYPAAKSSISALWIVTGVFGSVTILTMLGIVLTASLGLQLLPTAKLERYTHAIACAIITFCGVTIVFLGL